MREFGSPALVGRVLVVEDIPETRGWLEGIARRVFENAAIEGAASVPEARELMKADFDLALLDLNLPDGSGLDLLRSLRATGSDATCAVTTVIGEDSVVVAALCAGADGYILKESPAESIQRQLQEICVGTPALSPAITRRIMEHFARIGPVANDEANLTPRETEVLALIARGLTNREVALQMDISAATVAGHIKSVYSKLGISSRAEAAWHASRMGLRN